MKTVFVTGGSRGIGASIVKLFAQKNYNVAFCYKNSDAKAQSLVECLKEYGANVLSIRGDITNEADVTSMFDQIHKTFGKIHVLINNAGIADFNLLTDVSYARWQEILSTNTDGAFLCSKLAIPDMLNSGGSIINISSIWGITGASCEVAYSTSKAALIGFTKALAKELGPSNIRVNCVAPGVISTDMNAALSDDTVQLLVDDTPLCRVGTPLDIAKTVYFLASDDASFITGQIISTNGGFVI